jgi:hypothetical protein
LKAPSTAEPRERQPSAVGAKEHSFRALVGAAPRDLDARRRAVIAPARVKTRSQKLFAVKSSMFLELFQQASRRRALLSADMIEQSIHSSCSPAHARPLVAVHRAVTERVSVTSRTAAIKVSCSFSTANSPCAPRCRRRWPRAVTDRHTPVDMDAGSGCAHRPWDGLDAHQRTLCL